MQCHILEEALKSLPTPKAFVRAAWFFENFLWDIASAREQGEIAAFLSPLDRAYPMVATEDIGELAGAVLQETWDEDRILELEAVRRYSMLDASKVFSELLNKSVTAKAIPHDEWAALFEKQGMPADRTAPRIEMVDGFNSGWIEFERNGTEYFQGKRTLKEVARQLLA